MTQTATDHRWRIVPHDTVPYAGRRRGVVVAEDKRGHVAALARFDGPTTGSTPVELTLHIGPVWPPAEVVGELVRVAATHAARAGADRLVVDFDPQCPTARAVLAASGLDWRVWSTADAATAEASLGGRTARARHEPTSGSASLVRTRRPGVTVLPSAEGPSLRSDPRWTARRARRSDRLLARLIARRRLPAAR